LKLNQIFFYSPFNLVLADDGSIAPYSGPSHNFKSLLHIPNRPAHDYTILAQVDSKEGKEHLPKAANFLVSVIKVCIFFCNSPK